MGDSDGRRWVHQIIMDVHSNSKKKFYDDGDGWMQEKGLTLFVSPMQ